MSSFIGFLLIMLSASPAVAVVLLILHTMISFPEIFLNPILYSSQEQWVIAIIV